MLKTRADQLSALMIAAAVFGGGGVAYGISNLTVQLVAIGLLAVNYAAVRAFFREGPIALVILVALSLALPLVQIIPLPPTIWMALPGRDAVAEALGATGQVGWFAISVDSARTFVAFLGLLAPLAVLVLGWRSESNGVGRTVLVIIGLGLLNVLLGSIQIMGGGGMLYVENEMPGVLFGLFANRNSTALFLDCCLILMATLPSSRLYSVTGLVKAATATLLAVGVILTQSRTGAVLLTIPLTIAIARMVALRYASDTPSKRRQPAGSSIIIAVIALLCIPAVATMTSNTRIDSLLSRFDSSGEQRPLIWEDARYAAQRYWPVGAGMATFDEVFQSDESLENISPRRAGRAHNDYLEIAASAGLFGLVLVGAWAVWILYAAVRALASARRWPALSGAGILVAIALQSVLDYPLRNQTMLCLAAFAIVLLAPVARRRSPTGEAT